MGFFLTLHTRMEADRLPHTLIHSLLTVIHDVDINVAFIAQTIATGFPDDIFIKYLTAIDQPIDQLIRT